MKRERFLGTGPWQIKVAADGYMASGTDDPAVLYQDLVIGLVPSRGLNNGEPSLHAKCLGAAGRDGVVHRRRMVAVNRRTGIESEPSY